MDWQRCLSEIFAEMPEEWRINVSKEILVKKGIVWDPSNNTFHDRSVPVDFGRFMEEKCPNPLKTLAKWCAAGLDEIARMDDAMDIADLLENIFEKIKQSEDDEEEGGVLLGRRMLREAFIFSVAAIIKQKTNWKLPPTRVV